MNDPVNVAAEEAEGADGDATAAPRVREDLQRVRSRSVLGVGLATVCACEELEPAHVLLRRENLVADELENCVHRSRGPRVTPLGVCVACKAYIHGLEDEPRSTTSLRSESQRTDGGRLAGVLEGI